MRNPLLLLLRLRSDYDPFIKREDLETPYGLLALLHLLGGDVIVLVVFLGIAFEKWQRYSCSDTVPFKEWLACSWQAVLPGAMVMIVGFVFHLSRRSANAELLIAKKMFPDGRMPKHWIGGVDAKEITISVIVFFGLYLGMAYLSDHIVVVTLFMLGISCIDLNTRRLINARAGAYLDDPQYAPCKGDTNYTIINAIRRAVRHDLYGKPHMRKEKFRIAGCAAALALALSGKQSLSYVVLMATLITNEVVTWGWRDQRDRALRRAESRREENGLKPLESVAEEKEQKPRSRSPFSFTAWAVSVLYIGFAAWIASLEGVFSSRTVTLGFVNHGGMWGDFVLLPLVNGLVVPYLPKLTAKRSVVALAFLTCATVLTLLAHHHWFALGKAQGTTDFVFPSHSSGTWYNDLSVSGYLHVIYMSFELTLILAYVLLWLPPMRILSVSGLLSIHVIIGQVEPSWYSTHKIWIASTMIPTVVTVMLIWFVALIKIRQQSRRMVP